ncbi:MAG: hypothetical protein PHC60_05370 [Heliobacteriaceae bacterium]|nr:hypothetical protein [Heliobacteriaceae bacterium]MDD4587797.1 hypothetical protein [Heliobacteriaceae bacterium]
MITPAGKAENLADRKDFMGWFVNSKGEIEFWGGQEDWVRAARFAANCPAFALDGEEELVAEETRSCYNCRCWDRKEADPG